MEEERQVYEEAVRVSTGQKSTEEAMRVKRERQVKAERRAAK